MYKSIVQGPNLLLKLLKIQELMIRPDKAKTFKEAINIGFMVIQKLKFTEPTEIQEKSIPHILKGEDVIGASATGSGVKSG